MEAYQRGNLVMDWHPIKGGGGEKGEAVAILPVAPC